MKKLLTILLILLVTLLSAYSDGTSGGGPSNENTTDPGNGGGENQEVTVPDQHDNALPDSLVGLPVYHNENYHGGTCKEIYIISYTETAQWLIEHSIPGNCPSNYSISCTEMYESDGTVDKYYVENSQSMVNARAICRELELGDAVIR